LQEIETMLFRVILPAMALLALGGIVLICGAIGLIRRGQRRAASSWSPSQRGVSGDTLA
jgi:hypothetical protein